MCTRNQAISILSETFEMCNNALDCPVAEAYLYGSYARGDYHSESDVDILLTVDRAPEELASYRKIIARISSELSLKYDVTVSVTIKSREQFRKYADVLPYYKNVLAEGIRYAG